MLALLILAGCKPPEAESHLWRPRHRPGLRRPVHRSPIGDASQPDAAPVHRLPSSIICLVYNGLVNYDKNLNLEGDLAECWEVSPTGSPSPSSCAMG